MRVSGIYMHPTHECPAGNTQLNSAGGKGGWVGRQQNSFCLCSPTGPCPSKGPVTTLRFFIIVKQRAPYFCLALGPTNHRAVTSVASGGTLGSLPPKSYKATPSMAPHSGTWAMIPHLEQSQRWKYFVLNLHHFIASFQIFGFLFYFIF